MADLTEKYGKDFHTKMSLSSGELADVSLRDIQNLESAGYGIRLTVSNGQVIGYRISNGSIAFEYVKMNGEWKGVYAGFDGDADTIAVAAGREKIALGECVRKTIEYYCIMRKMLKGSKGFKEQEELAGWTGPLY